MKIYFDNILIDQNYYKAISNDYHLFSDTFYLGSTACNTFTINIDKRAVSSQPSLVTLKDNNDNLIANLVVDNIKESDDGSYIYTLTDKMVDFEFNYNAFTIINSSTSGKVSLYKILSDICNIAGIELGVTSIENEVDVSWYDNTITARNYIGFIAELQGKYAYIDKNGKLNFASHKKAPSKSISFDELGDYKIGEYHKITRVVYEMGQVKYEYGDGSNDTLYISSDNPFVVNGTQIEYIYNQIKDFAFYSFEVNRCIIDYNIRAGDVITFKKNNLEYPTIAQYSLTYNGGWSGGYSLNIKSKKQETTKNIGMSEEFKRLKIEVDRDMNSITQTVGSQIKEINSNLSKTNTNLSNLSNIVDTLSDDIDGVSADFEDFKDNEYIQSIDNLQKQIDGAIQFWNGAEIPKPNSSDLITYNYPANQWTTENDKINHQADIYTVVQDVQGEMKQGKSYRFDKVKDEWQWIELTDNELSAVQAIAQEALDKVNKNTTEISTIKKNVSELQQTDEQIKASVESIDKQIIPTATATGSNIYVEDASDDPLIQLEIEGKSTQETTQGNQLVDFGNVHFNNAIYEFENDILTISSDNTGTYNNVNCHITNFVKNNPGKVLKFDFEDMDLSNFNSSSGIICQLKVTIDGVNTYYGLYNKNSGNSTYTIPEDTSGITQVIFYVYANNTSTVVDSSIVISKPMLQFGTDELEYEKYTGGISSPNPDYPREIVSVGYENLLPTDENSWEQGSISQSTGENITSTTRLRTVEYIGVDGLTEYYISMENTKYCFLNIILYDNNKNFINAYNNIYDTINGTTKRNITFPSNTRYIRITLRNTDNTATITPSEILTIKPMLCLGSIAHPYIPYNKYGIEVIHRGKNILPNKLSSQTSNGITVTVNKDSSINFKGTPIAQASFMIATKMTDLILNQTYTLSSHTTMPTGVYFRIADDTDTNYFYGLGIKDKEDSNSLTFTYDGRFISGLYYAYVWFGSYSIGNEVDFTLYPQLEIGDSATEFKKHQENILTILLNDSLKSLPNGVKDIAYIKNNKLYVDRKVGSVVLDGSETITVQGKSTNGYNRYIVNKTLNNKIHTDMNTKAPILCDYFNVINNSQQFNGAEGIMLRVNQQNQLLVLDEEFPTITSVVDFLVENNTEVDYELETPVTEELGEIEMPSIFKGVNHISTTDELEPTINIEYVRDTTLSSYVEKQIDNVMTIQNRKIGELIVQDDEITQRVSATETNLNNNYMTTDQITAQTDSLKKDINYNTTKMTELSTTIDGVNIKIQTMGAKIENMNYSFQTDALKISTSESKINSKFDNTGVKVYNYELLMAIFNHKGTGVGDLIVTGTAQIGYLKFMKSTKNGKQITAIHHIISEIQSLEDLESDE